MDNLIRETTPIELYAWIDVDAELPGWDMLRGCAFGSTHGAPAGGTPLPGGSSSPVQNYFAEYHLEYFRQRRFNHFPSRLHALLLFATRTDAETFRKKHPTLVYGKYLVQARTRGAYVCSFHDASWLDYLRLPHNLSLSALDEMADHYWSGRIVEEIGLTFMDEPWHEPPVIEALFQGTLDAVNTRQPSGWLPGFS